MTTPTRARSAWALALVAALGWTAGCSREPSDAGSAGSTRSEAAPRDTTTVTPSAPSGRLDGALLIARYQPEALVALVQRLPRPTPTGSPLVELFANIVAQVQGDPRERLAALGLRDDATIELSVRPLTDRAPAVRKLLGELAAEPQPDPQLLARLRGQAGTLGLHLRAAAAVTDEARLHAALRAVVGSAAEASPACAALREAGASLCVGGEGIWVWAQPAVEGRVQVDGIYLFGGDLFGGDLLGRDGGDEDLAWILARARAWPAQAAGADARAVEPLAPGVAMAIEVFAAGTAELLAAEALADAVTSLAAGTLDEHAYLDRAQAIAELLPPADARVFEGLRLRVSLAGEAMIAELGWIPSERPAVALAELFGPDPAPRPTSSLTPSVPALCADAAACVRLTRLDLTPRFAALAVGPFADTTGVGRVLRHAGDEGMLLIGLASWPNLLGTAGRMAAPAAGGAGGSGLLREAQAALVEDSLALGGALVELGDAPDADQLAAFLQVGPTAYAAIRPLAGVLGLGPRPLTLAGVEAQVDRGRYEDTPVYFVDERERGGWFVIADADARARWLLTRPREPADPDEILRVEVRELGRLSVREGLPFADDPPVRAWLEARGLDLRLRLTPEGPIMTVALTPRQ